MQSCIYQGRVRHRRFLPVAHEFSYSISLLYLDLDELPEVVQQLPLLSASSHGVAAICRQDHWGEAQTGLAAAVRAEVLRATGRPARGPIRLLTLWRSFGCYFSPVSLFYCFAPATDDGPERLEVIVAEVNNTPWRERFCYVLWEGNRVPGRTFEFSHPKDRHVSPFLDIGLQYRWRLTAPGGASLTVQIEVGQEPILLDATLYLRRRELTARTWLRQLVAYPLLPVRVLSAIYFEAFRLWIKRAPFYPHPSQRPTAPSPTVHDKVTRDEAESIERRP